MTYTEARKLIEESLPYSKVQALLSACTIKVILDFESHPDVGTLEVEANSDRFYHEVAKAIAEHG